MDLIQKYNCAADTLDRSDAELKADFETARALIAAEGDTPRAGSLSVIRDWIGQERRARIPGIGRLLPPLDSVSA